MKDSRPPHICKSCFENPVRQDPIFFAVYCRHSSTLGTKGPFGWQLIWPVYPDDVAEVLEGASRMADTALKVMLAPGNPTAEGSH